MAAGKATAGWSHLFKTQPGCRPHFHHHQTIFSNEPPGDNFCNGWRKFPHLACGESSLNLVVGHLRGHLPPSQLTSDICGWSQRQTVHSGWYIKTSTPVPHSGWKSSATCWFSSCFSAIGWVLAQLWPSDVISTEGALRLHTTYDNHSSIPSNPIHPSDI